MEIVLRSLCFVPKRKSVSMIGSGSELEGLVFKVGAALLFVFGFF